MTVTPAPAPSTSRGRFHRSRDERLLTGVAGGLGARIGVDPIVVRIALVILTLAGGAGILLYALGWYVSDEVPDDAEPQARPFDGQQAVALGLIALGTMIGLRSVGIWVSDALVLPAVLLGVASAIIWTRGDVRLERADGDATPSSTARAIRIAIGALLALSGLAVLLSQTINPLPVLAPLLGLTIGAILLFGPLLMKLADQLGTERLERARSEAREEIAAHLHDSVLQTLALIQRAEDQPRRMVQLARRQERELRSWLFGGDADGDRRLAAAVASVVDDVEAAWNLTIDVVVVGDAEVTGDVRALLGAIHEALRNVAKHAGVTEASLYVEVTDTAVEAFIRDRGHGFDAALVSSDRHGVRESILARVQRHGGRARITGRPGVGTEVEVSVPHRPTASATRNGSHT